jgi:RHS repeat-associated protein
MLRLEQAVTPGMLQKASPVLTVRTEFLPGTRATRSRVTPDLKVDWFVGACPEPRGERSESCPEQGGRSERRGEWDAHGNVVATVDGQGATWGEVRNVRKFDVWGSQRGDTVKPATPPDHAYCGNLGHTQDDELGGLIYMRARYYEPWTGRFINEDPGRHGGNWFAYCGANPILSVDASGELPVFVVAFLIGFVFAGVWEATREVLTGGWSSLDASKIFGAALLGGILGAAFALLGAAAVALGNTLGYSFGGVALRGLGQGILAISTAESSLQLGYKLLGGAAAGSLAGAASVAFDALAALLGRQVQISMLLWAMDLDG